MAGIQQESSSESRRAIVGFRTSRTTTKVVALYLLLVLLLAVLAAYVVARMIAGSIEQRIIDALLDAGRAANDEIVEIERQHLQAFRLMAFTEGVDVAVEQGDAARLRRAIEPLQLNDEIDLVEVVDRQGRHILSLQLGDAGVVSAPTGTLSIEQLEITRKVLAGETDHLGDKFSDLVSTSAGWAIYTAGPVKSLDNRLVGAILVGTRLPKVVEQLTNETLTNVSIYAADGSVIESSLPAEAPSRPSGVRMDPAEYSQLLQDGSFVLVRSIQAGERDYRELLGRMEVRREPVTVLGVALPNTLVAEAGSELRNQMILVVAVVVLVGSLFGLLLALFGRRTMRDGGVDQVEPRSNEEAGAFAHSVEELVSGLSREASARFLAKDDAAAVQSGEIKSGGERREVTVLMSDIRGFTALSELMDPEGLVTFLNKYFSAMIDAVMKHGGTLDKFIGDAILAVYNAPAAYPDHATRAVKTAMEMRARLAEFNAERVENGQQPIRIGIGIHTGHVVAGHIGAEHRTEYTVIGDTVSMTQRVKDLCKVLQTDLLISETTYERVKDEIDCGPPQEIVPRGRGNVAHVYPVYGLKLESSIPPTDSTDVPPTSRGADPEQPDESSPSRRRALDRGDA